MTPKQYLSQITEIETRINLKLECLAEMKAKIINVSSKIKLDVIQSSNKSDFTDSINRMIDIENEVNELLDLLIDKRRKIESQIYGLDNELYRIVLTRRYILGWDLKSIATDIPHDYGYIRKVHGWALEAFKKKYLLEQKGTQRNIHR